MKTSGNGKTTANLSESQVSLVRQLAERPFDANVQVKRAVSDAFHLDSVTHWERFNILRHCRADEPLASSQLSFRVKVFVDLLFATECALKSLILSLSPNTESPEAAYENAKRKSHRLADLATEVQGRAKAQLDLQVLKRSDLALLSKVQDGGVGWRYSVDVFFMVFPNRTLDQMLERGPIYGMVESVKWMQRFRSLGQRLLKMSKKYNSEAFREHRSIWGGHLERERARLEEFAKNVKLLRVGGGRRK